MKISQEASRLEVYLLLSTWSWIQLLVLVASGAIKAADAVLRSSLAEPINAYVRNKGEVEFAQLLEHINIREHNIHVRHLSTYTPPHALSSMQNIALSYDVRKCFHFWTNHVHYPNSKFDRVRWLDLQLSSSLCGLANVDSIKTQRKSFKMVDDIRRKYALLNQLSQNKQGIDRPCIFRGCNFCFRVKMCLRFNVLIIQRLNLRGSRKQGKIKQKTKLHWHTCVEHD
jgi:hypothetical protein